MMNCSAALKIYPSFQHYNDSTEFTFLLCTKDDNYNLSGDDVEWLSPNFTLLVSSPDFRIYGIVEGKFPKMHLYLVTGNFQIILFMKTSKITEIFEIIFSKRLNNNES